MSVIEIKTKVLDFIDYKTIDVRDQFPKFMFDKAKLEADMKRIQYAKGSRTNAEEIAKGDLVLLDCASSHPHYQKSALYVIVGKNLYSKELEEKLIGLGLGSAEVTLAEDAVKVTVTVKEIVRNTIPAMTDENVKTWGINGVSTVEDLKRFCFNRQVDNFRDDSEEADMVNSMVFMKVMEQSHFEQDEEELAIITRYTERMVESYRKLFAETGEGGALPEAADGKILAEDGSLQEDTGENEAEDIDMEELFSQMVGNTLNAAALGYQMCLAQDKLVYEADYQAVLEKRSAALRQTTAEVAEVYTRTDYASEYYSEIYLNELDKTVGDAMKAYYYKQNNKPDVYDVAIIGAGPAGLSAALTLKLHEKTILWFGTDTLSDKVEKSEKIANYAGFLPGSGKSLNETFRQQIKEADLELTDKMVTQISRFNDEYMLLADNELYKAKTVLFSIGAVAAKGITNELELLGHGVSYCATCDGFLYKGKTIAVFCGSRRYEHEVAYLAELAETVYLYASYKDVEIDLPNVVRLEQPMKAVLGEERVSGIEMKDGSSYQVDGVFFLRKSVAPATILKELELNGAHIVVNRACETNIPGCYAAGDCTGRPYQIAKAVGEGNVAAHGIVGYLAGEVHS